MARRRFMNQSTGFGVPTPITIKTPQFDTSGLTAAYEWMAVDKHFGFQMAFAWYNTAINGEPGRPSILLFQDPLDADRQKAFDRAVKAQKLGDGGTTEGEKIQGWTTALHLYESKVWPKRPLPKVDDALASTTPSKRVVGVGVVLTALNAAFRGHASFKLTAAQDRSVEGTEISLPVSEVEVMVGQPLMKTILAEVMPTAKQISIVNAVDEKGNPRKKLDGAKFMEMGPKLMESVYSWMASQDGKLAKPVGKAPKASKVNPVGRPPKQQAAQSFRNTQVIHIVNLQQANLSGKRGQAILMIKDGMTIGAYRTVVRTTPGFNSGYVPPALEVALKAGAITIS